MRVFVLLLVLAGVVNADDRPSEPWRRRKDTKPALQQTCFDHSVTALWALPVIFWAHTD